MLEMLKGVHSWRISDILPSDRYMPKNGLFPGLITKFRLEKFAPVINDEGPLHGLNAQFCGNCASFQKLRLMTHLVKGGQCGVGGSNTDKHQPPVGPFEGCVPRWRATVGMIGCTVGFVLATANKGYFHLGIGILIISSIVWLTGHHTCEDADKGEYYNRNGLPIHLGDNVPQQLLLTSPIYRGTAIAVGDMSKAVVLLTAIKCSSSGIIKEAFRESVGRTENVFVGHLYVENRIPSIGTQSLVVPHKRAVRNFNWGGRRNRKIAWVRSDVDTLLSFWHYNAPSKSVLNGRIQRWSIPDISNYDGTLRKSSAVWFLFYGRPRHFDRQPCDLHGPSVRKLLLHIPQLSVQIKKTEESYGSSGSSYSIQRFRDSELPSPKVLLLAIFLIIFGGWLNSHGIDKGPFYILMTGWFLLAVGMLLALLFLVPFIAHFAPSEFGNTVPQQYRLTSPTYRGTVITIGDTPMANIVRQRESEAEA